MYSSRTCEGISLDARRRANGRRCADVRLVVVVHHGRLPRLVGVIHRRARVKEEYRRRVSPVADAVVDSVVEGSQPASSRSSRLEKHTNVPSATESRRSSVPLGMSTVAHQPTPAMGECRNSGESPDGTSVLPQRGRGPNFSVTSPKMSKLGGLSVVSSRIVNPQRGNEPRVKKTYPASIMPLAAHTHQASRV